MHSRLTSPSLIFFVTCLIILMLTRCECNNHPSNGEQPTRVWVTGEMKVIGNQLESAIKQFKGKTAGLVEAKDTLFQLVTAHRTNDQINEDGKNMQYGKFSMSQPAKKEALEEIVLDNTDIDKILNIVPNKPMEHKVSSGSTKVFTTNFGDRSIFFGYSCGLFAQDEVQIAEMPHLAMLKHTLKKELSAEKHGAFLCANVPRYVDLDTNGIYGHGLSKIKPNDLATTLKSKLKYRSPITYNNIISIVAPTDLSTGKPYNVADFSDFFLPAFCAYQAVHQIFPDNAIQVETGNWGAGAFGNDIRMAAISQILAAMLSKTQLDIYPSSKGSEQGWKAGIQLLKNSIIGLEKTRTALTARNIFIYAQEIATKAGDPIKKGTGNGT